MNLQRLKSFEELILLAARPSDDLLRVLRENGLVRKRSRKCCRRVTRDGCLTNGGTRPHFGKVRLCHLRKSNAPTLKRSFPFFEGSKLHPFTILEVAHAYLVNKINYEGISMIMTTWPTACSSAGTCSGRPRKVVVVEETAQTVSPGTPHGPRVHLSPGDVRRRAEDWAGRLDPEPVTWPNHAPDSGWGERDPQRRAQDLPVPLRPGAPTSPGKSQPRVRGRRRDSHRSHRGLLLSDKAVPEEEKREEHKGHPQLHGWVTVQCTWSSTRILYSNYRQLGFFNQFGEFSSLAKFVSGSQEVASPVRLSCQVRAALFNNKWSGECIIVGYIPNI